jgi:Ca2+-transporting ATPase
MASIYQGSTAVDSSDPDVLSPHPGEEQMYQIEDNPFAFSPGQLSKLINPKSLDAFLAIGGLNGLQRGLQTDIHSGLSMDETELSRGVTFDEAVSNAVTNPTALPHRDLPIRTLSRGEHITWSLHYQPASNSFADRKRVFGENQLPERKSKSFLELAWIALKDKVLILLSIAAAISLALGLYQTFGTEHTEDEGAKVEWVEGVAIIAAILIVVTVSALNDWQKERQFRKLNQKKEDRLVKVVRSGKPLVVPIQDILVGDVMLLEQGDVIPVDGIYIQGHNVSCDESSATGESDLIKKIAADAVYRALHEPGHNRRKLDPFIISGAKVLDGVGSFLVTAVGRNSSHGRTMMALRDDGGLTPLQFKLNLLAGMKAASPPPHLGGT